MVYLRIFNFILVVKVIQIYNVKLNIIKEKIRKGNISSIFFFLFLAHDGAEPSSNSIACSNLLRLASYLERNELKDKAEQLLCAFGKSLTEMPIMFPQLTLALLSYYNTTQVYIYFYFLSMLFIEHYARI